MMFIPNENGQVEIDLTRNSPSPERHPKQELYDEMNSGRSSRFQSGFGQYGRYRCAWIDSDNRFQELPTACSKEFTDKEMLESHISMDHLDWVKYECEHCPQMRFSLRSVLVSHLRDNHRHLTQVVKYKMNDQKEAMLADVMQRSTMNMGTIAMPEMRNRRTSTPTYRDQFSFAQPPYGYGSHPGGSHQTSMLFGMQPPQPQQRPFYAPTPPFTPNCNYNTQNSLPQSPIPACTCDNGSRKHRRSEKCPKLQMHHIKKETFYSVTGEMQEETHTQRREVQNSELKSCSSDQQVSTISQTKRQKNPEKAVKSAKRKSNTESKESTATKKSSLSNSAEAKDTLMKMTTKAKSRCTLCLKDFEKPAKRLEHCYGVHLAEKKLFRFTCEFAGCDFKSGFKSSTKSHKDKHKGHTVKEDLLEDEYQKLFATVNPPTKSLVQPKQKNETAILTVVPKKSTPNTAPTKQKQPLASTVVKNSVTQRELQTVISGSTASTAVKSVAAVGKTATNTKPPPTPAVTTAVAAKNGEKRTKSARRSSEVKCEAICNIAGCGAKLSSLIDSVLYAHVRKAHFKKPLYKCNKCDKSKAKCKENVQRHVSNIHCGKAEAIQTEHFEEFLQLVYTARTKQP